MECPYCNKPFLIGQETIYIWFVEDKKHKKIHMEHLKTNNKRKEVNDDIYRD